MGTEARMKRTGLRLFEARTPLKDYFSAVLDLEGEWTAGMLASEDQPTTDDRGLMVWEGSCEIVTTDAGTDDEFTSYTFEGEWRCPTNDELLLLGGGFRPFSAAKFPSSDDELITIPA